MNEMYTMGLSLHSFGSVAILVVIFMNLFLLISTKELKKYKRINAIFLIPLTWTIFGLVIFTGTIMMAAKHLEFTFENIVMIFLSLVFIVLERKRIKALSFLNDSKERVFDGYRPFARRILQVEFILVLLIAFWMWML